LASVEHLPGSAENGARAGRSTGSTARTEWAPLAGKALPLAVVPDLAEARRVLVSEFPDDAAVIDAILVPLAGRSFVHLPPTLLLGPPGTGKSRLTRRLGEILGLAVTVYSCGGVADSSLIGTSRQWSTGRATVPLQAIKQAGAASVLVVLDELSRAGTRADNGRLVDGVLALTEAETSRRYQDPFLECPTDLSAVSWLATANSVAGLDPALLSRFRVLTLGPRTAASLPSLTKGILADVRRERGLDATWLPDLDEEEAGVLAENWPGGSVRVLRRLIETVLASREHLATRN
jgi:ATP-dependent Lon protease